MKPAGFWAALGFLTRLPTPPLAYNEQAARASLIWYPVIGLLLGIILVGMSHLFVNMFVNAIILWGVLLVAVWMALTGGLHLDGLADTADAWVGGLGDRERTLAIMKDPHVGSAALIWVCVFLMAKAAALGGLLQLREFEALLLAPLWGRMSPLCLFLSTPYVRPHGLGSPLAGALTGVQVMLVIVAVLTFTAVFATLTETVALTLAACVIFILYRTWLMVRLGGTTGDTAGAFIEITELTCLLTLLAF